MERVKYQQKTTDNNASGKTSYEKTYNSNSSNNYKKQRFQNKDTKIRTRFGFEYDESKIGYNTDIPEMPQKVKAKPDQTKYNKKVEQLEKKAEQLKKLRKQKKDTYKHGNKGLREQIQQEKHKINLAKACLIVLSYDKEQQQRQTQNVDSKISNHRRKIQILNKPKDRQFKNVKIQEMSYVQLMKQEQRIEHDISIKNLTKAQEVQLSNKLNKIKKRRAQVPKQNISSRGDDQKLSQIQSHRNAIQKLRHLKQNNVDKITDIQNKIQSIEDNIVDFQQKIQEIYQKQRNTDNAQLLALAAELKPKIYAIWDQLQEMKKQHTVKLGQFEEEQEKIKYIQWAKQIKIKKTQEWELQKQQRKRQKLRQKDRQKKSDEKDDKAPKQGQVADQNKPTYERTKINRNQKEIDVCAFLIQYCKDLNSGSSTNQHKNNAQNQVKIEEVLKKGEWANMKNVQVIQSKKKKNEQAAQQKNFKKKQNKNPVAQMTDKFSHTYFVAQIFDSVKVLPPTKAEELEKMINELEDKMQYYLAHPDEGVQKTLLPQGKQSERETKSKVSRKIINTEQFPSLR